LMRPERLRVSSLRASALLAVVSFPGAGDIAALSPDLDAVEWVAHAYGRKPQVDSPWKKDQPARVCHPLITLPYLIPPRSRLPALGLSGWARPVGATAGACTDSWHYQRA